MQSLVPSMSLNNLIPFTIFFSFVYLSLNKNSTPPDWQNWDPSGLAKQDPTGLGKTGPLRIGKIGPLRIGKIGTFSDWQNYDPSGVAKKRPFRIGKIGTLPDWDPSGFVKIAFQWLSKFSPDTFPDTFSDAIMLLELTRKCVFSFPRPFRIEAKPLI